MSSPSDPLSPLVGAKDLDPKIVDPSTSAPALVAPLAPAYHDELRQHLETTEPELWSWFAETLDPGQAEVEEAELELLKSAYRLEGDVHQTLVADALLLAAKLGLDNEITLYQELHGSGRNARVQIFGDDVHVVFSGDLLSLLDEGEQRAVLAHELAHVSLLLNHDGVYRVLDSMMHRLADDPAAHDAIGETARRLRLHTEVYADAIAAQLTGQRNDVISAVVKVESGLRNVDPVAYLRQAEEILNAEDRSTAAWSHPELHVRVACLAANVAGGVEGADPAVIRSMIEGADDLDRADLLSQVRIQTLTRRVLLAGRSAAGPSPEIESHIDSFIGLAATSTPFGDPPNLDDDELAVAGASIRFLAAALLVDLALVADGVGGDGTTPGEDTLIDSTATDDGTVTDTLVDGNFEPRPGDELAILRRLGAEAERIGVVTEFDRLVSRATEQSLAEVRKLRKGDR